MVLLMLHTADSLLLYVFYVCEVRALEWFSMLLI